MMQHVVRLTSALLFAGAASTAAAQSRDDLCWRGRPLARCRSFLLFEFTAPRFSAGTKLDPSVGEGRNGHRRWDHALASQFVYDVGLMRNVTSRDAVGATAELGVITDDPRTPGLFGATARYRRWLTPRVSADGALGVLRMPVGVQQTAPFFASGYQRTSVRRPALTADARFGFADLLGLNARAMIANDGRGRTHGAIFFGASIGSTVTAVTTGAAAAIVAFEVARCCQGDDVTILR